MWHIRWWDMWRRTPLPLHETPFLCRAAWCTETPAVRTCHGGFPGNHRTQENVIGIAKLTLSRLWPQKWRYTDGKKYATRIRDLPIVVRFQLENCDVSCSLVIPEGDNLNEQLVTTQSSTSNTLLHINPLYLRGINTRGLVNLRCGDRPAGLCAVRCRTSSWGSSCWPRESPERRTRRCELPSPCESPGWFLLLLSRKHILSQTAFPMHLRFFCGNGHNSTD